MLLYHCYHFKYIELNMISLKSVVELLLLNMWQTSSGIKEDNFDFVSKFDMLKRWSPSSLFTTPNGKRGVTRTCFKCLENIILRMKHVLPTALLIWNDDFSDSVPPQLFKRRGSRVKILFQYHLSGSEF